MDNCLLPDWVLEVILCVSFLYNIISWKRNLRQKEKPHQKVLGFTICIFLSTYLLNKM